MRNTTLCMPILILMILVSCKKEIKEVEHDYLNTIVSKINPDKDVKWIVLLPGLGCHGCIQEGEAFVKDHIGNKQIFFVLTKIESYKILQNKLGIRFEEHENIYLDKKHEINFPTDNGVYPCIVQIQNGKVRDHEFQSPANGAFQKLRQKITDNP